MESVVAQDLPDYVNGILAAIARALNGKCVSPESLAAIAGQIRGCVEGHKTWTEHQPRRPKGSRPRLKAVYTIAVTGPVIDGRWHFTPGQFDELLQNIDQSQEPPKVPLIACASPKVSILRRAIRFLMGSQRNNP